MAELQRFKDAQGKMFTGFDDALRQIRGGRKTGHWIWYIFPQLQGLGNSALSRAFAIADADEAAAYLRDTELRERLLSISTAVADQLRGGAALAELMGSDIDARKVVASLTLFGHVAKSLADHATFGLYEPVATVATDILAVAEKQGYPPCAFTRKHLGETSW